MLLTKKETRLVRERQTGQGAWTNDTVIITQDWREVNAQTVQPLRVLS